MMAYSPVHNVALFLCLLIFSSSSLAGSLLECSKWSIRFGWVVATCPNDADPPVQVESSLLLNQIVSVNNQSQLIVRIQPPNHKTSSYSRHQAKKQLSGAPSTQA